MAAPGPGVDRRGDAGAGTYRSPELRLVLTAGAVLLLAAALVLEALHRHSDVLLLDLREWQLTASSGRRLDRLAAEARPERESRRPFRLTLEMPAAARPGVAVAAERRFEVDPHGTYCFEVWTWTPPADDAAAAAGEVSRLVVAVDGEAAASVPLLDSGRGRRVVVDGIRAPDGRLHLRIELRSLSDRPQGARRRASRTHLDFASLRKCSAAR